MSLSVLAGNCDFVATRFLGARSRKNPAAAAAPSPLCCSLTRESRPSIHPLSPCQLWDAVAVSPWRGKGSQVLPRVLVLPINPLVLNVGSRTQADYVFRGGRGSMNTT